MKADPARRKGPEGWLLLIHQIPPKPAYLRVKIARRLHRMGAVAVKNSVYVLPDTEASHEDFQWVAREIAKGAGEATICRARFADGLRDPDIVKLFNTARDEDYRALAGDARAAAGAEPARLKRRFEEVGAIDFFRAPARKAAEEAIARLEDRLESGSPAEPETRPLRLRDFRARTWVTRKGLGIDRLASAWLIRRFIDPRARFLFVPGKGYRPGKGELRFDMFEGEFTHEGDRCTFETLLERMGLRDPALHAVAKIVHDIDLKDGKFGREEARGIDRLIAGLCMAHKGDEARLARAFPLFDDLCEYFRRKRE